MAILGIISSPIFFENSFAQQDMSPHQQWKNFADLDILTCKPGHVLLQKTNGSPSCVMPSTYMKLVDRGYGNYDSSILSKHPEMMNQLMQNIASNEELMSHWHGMLKQNPTVMSKTMVSLASQMKDNPQLLKNMLGPMTSDPKLRETMIQTMKNHPSMETSLKQHSGWMDSVHHSMMNSDMGKNMHNSMCSWCPSYQMPASPDHFMEFSNSDKMMNIIHDLWINSDKSDGMYDLMMNNPSHMAQMSDEMMESMLGAVMDDEYLRQQMIVLMMEHDDFMNTIRHDTPQSDP